MVTRWPHHGHTTALGFLLAGHEVAPTTQTDAYGSLVPSRRDETSASRAAIRARLSPFLYMARALNHFVAYAF